MSCGVIALATILIGTASGYRAFTDMSSSMEPSISAGDVVIARPIAPTAVRIGDVVTFQDPRNRSRLITHRVRGMRLDGHRAAFTTRGDANNSVERWSVDTRGQVGRVVMRLPLVGHLLVALMDPRKRLLFVVLPAILLAAAELWRIWRPRERRAGHPADVPATAALERG